MDEINLLDCPYCGRKAELILGKEMSDTSRMHRIQCSYIGCIRLEMTLSGWQPDYKVKVKQLKADWNAAVGVINKNHENWSLNNV